MESVFLAAHVAKDKFLALFEPAELSPELLSSLNQFHWSLRFTVCHWACATRLRVCLLNPRALAEFWCCELCPYLLVCVRVFHMSRLFFLSGDGGATGGASDILCHNFVRLLHLFGLPSRPRLQALRPNDRLHGRHRV